MKKSQKSQKNQKNQQVAKKKMTVKTKSCNSCRCISTLLFLSVSIWIFYDVSKHGSWNESCTSKALNRTGVYNYTNLALDRAQEGRQWLHDRIEERFPGFSAKAEELTAPYLELCCNMHKVSCNIVRNMKDYIVSKGPIIQETVEYYAPGLVDTTFHYACATWTFIVDSNIAVFAYLRDHVFVGSLSPENMKNVALEVATSAYNAAAEGIQYVYNKIQAAIH